MGRPVPATSRATDGKRRSVWRAKYRLPDGRQVKKTIGPAGSGRGRPPAGYVTKRTAVAWLSRTRAEAGSGTLPGKVCTGATVADACAEYLRYIEQDRQRKPSTLRDYDSVFRNHVLPQLGTIFVEDLTPERVQHWAAHEIDTNRRLAKRTREKTITVFHGVMERARKLYRLPSNPVADVEKPPRAPKSTSSRPWRSRSSSGALSRCGALRCAETSSYVIGRAVRGSGSPELADALSSGPAGSHPTSAGSGVGEWPRPSAAAYAGAARDISDPDRTP
jgi:hypothetical protein